MKPNLTKDQRKRLFLLARLLDRVPRKRFHMNMVISKDGCPLKLEENPEAANALAQNECGYAACAMGWGLSHAVVSDDSRDEFELVASLGFTNKWEKNGPEFRLFNGGRKVGPRTVASDIRRYLKDGTLPKA